MGTVWFRNRVGNGSGRDETKALRRCYFWKGNPIFVLGSPIRHARWAFFQALSRALPIVASSLHGLCIDRAWRSANRGWARTPRPRLAALVVAEPARDVGVGVDAPVAEEGPAGADGVDLGEINLLDEDDLAVGRSADEDAAVGSRDEALTPELDAAGAARVGLEPRAVHGDHEATVRDGVPALHGLPGPVLALAELRLLLGVPADRRR